MQEIGFGLTREMVGNVVMDYLKDKGRQNPFAHGKPGNDWWSGFMRRWPKLVERKPQHLPANRAMSLTEVMDLKGQIGGGGGRAWRSDH